MTALVVTFRVRLHRSTVAGNIALYGDHKWLRRRLSRRRFYFSLIVELAVMGYLAFSFLYFDE